MTSAQQSMLSRMGFVCEYGYANGPEQLRGGGDNDPDAEQEEEEQQKEQEQQAEEQAQQKEQEQEQQAALEDFIAPGGASHDQIQESRERMLLRAAFHVR